MTNYIFTVVYNSTSLLLECSASSVHHGVLLINFYFNIKYDKPKTWSVVFIIVILHLSHISIIFWSISVQFSLFDLA